ncbi:uncharacterized protein K444DRAFT_664462 [Hyaloscypha bicolor E]|uniref:Uncharacterized protein n=1 Tax=Hyaloscypha bicolor E TaxID=1095630 RepID=A0A2J6T5R1_9HELO|nr:uncharacterized protein K444DRAFT_664462 [Hyaloscypha bicolor E]PMD58360.1 hypothetical protein K444DRAFT_664462 [Hyaloscypha bicolor E]
MAPIRAGFIRLSYNRGWARNLTSHALMLQMTPKPPAIYNSTPECAHKAIEEYELLSISKLHTPKLAIVGLQRRFSPVIQKSKEVVDSEMLVKVLSSTFTGQAQYGGGTVVKGFEHSLKLESGVALYRPNARPSSAPYAAFRQAVDRRLHF